MVNFRIFCDMDGVLTDFEGTFKRLFKCSVAAYERAHGEGAIWSLINTKGIDFWCNLPWLPGAKRLWKFIANFDPVIVSARPKFSYSRYVVPGKMQWVREELGTTVRLSIGRRKDKIVHCRFGAILIDDYEKTVLEWRERGGVGIVHKSAASTLRLVTQWYSEVWKQQR